MGNKTSGKLKSKDVGNGGRKKLTLPPVSSLGEINFSLSRTFRDIMKSYSTDMSKDCLGNVLLYLDNLKDYFSFMLVCKEWYMVCSTGYIPYRFFFQLYVENFIKNGSLGKDEEEKFIHKAEEDFERYRRDIFMNYWENEYKKCVEICRSHTKGNVDIYKHRDEIWDGCILDKKNLLIVAGAEKNVYIYQIESNSKDLKKVKEIMTNSSILFCKPSPSQEKVLICEYDVISVLELTDSMDSWQLQRAYADQHKQLGFNCADWFNEEWFFVSNKYNGNMLKVNPKTGIKESGPYAPNNGGTLNSFRYQGNVLLMQICGIEATSPKKIYTRDSLEIYEITKIRNHERKGRIQVNGIILGYNMNSDQSRIIVIHRNYDKGIVYPVQEEKMRYYCNIFKATISIFDREKGHVLHILESINLPSTKAYSKTNDAYSIAFMRSRIYSEFEDFMFTATEKSHAKVYNVKYGFVVHRFKHLNSVGCVNVVLYSPKHNIFVTGGDDSTIRVFRKYNTELVDEKPMKIEKKLDFSKSKRNIVIGKTISSGAYGVVKQGILRMGLMKVPVAIKIIPLKTREDIKVIEHEVEIMVKVENKNVLKCYGYYVDDNSAHIVLEMCSKGDLFGFKKKISSFKNSKKIKLNFLMQIARGLKALHDMGLVHRDVKSQNILITENNTLKICDFGTTKSTISIGETFCGTAEYLPPEQVVSNVNADEPKLIDIYSFGILIWELWTLKSPFGEMRKKSNFNQFQLINKIHKEKLRPDVNEMIDAPDDLVFLMTQCWDADPRKRPESFGEIIKMLKEM